MAPMPPFRERSEARPVNARANPEIAAVRCRSRTASVAVLALSDSVGGGALADATSPAPPLSASCIRRLLSKTWCRIFRWQWISSDVLRNCGGTTARTLASTAAAGEGRGVARTCASDSGVRGEVRALSNALGTHVGSGDMRVRLGIDRKVAWGWGFEFCVLSTGASRTVGLRNVASSCKEPQDAPPD